MGPLNTGFTVTAAKPYLITSHIINSYVRNLTQLELQTKMKFYSMHLRLKPYANNFLFTIITKHFTLFFHSRNKQILNKMWLLHVSTRYWFQTLEAFTTVHARLHTEFFNNYSPLSESLCNIESIVFSLIDLSSSIFSSRCWFKTWSICRWA